MGDDYEILDPTRTEAKFTDDAAPSTPIMSSMKQPVTDGGQRNGGDNKMGNESNKRQKLKGKKDVEMQIEQGKRSKKDEKEKKQKDDDDEFDYVYEYESAASSMRRAFLIATASGFVICILYALLGIGLLLYNKQLDFKFD